MKITQYHVENISASDNIYNKYTISVARSTRKLLFSNWFLVFVVLLIIVTTMFSVYYGAKDTGTSIFDSSYWSTGVVLMTTATFIAAIAGILGDLMMDRANKIALPFYFIYIFVYGAQCYFWSLYYEMFQQFLVFILVLLSLINWGRKNAKEEETKIKFLNVWSFSILCITILIITILLGSIMEWVVNPWIGNATIIGADGFVDYDLTPWWALRGEDPYPFMDAYVFISFLGAWLLFTKKYQNAYWIMFASIMGYFVVYGLMAFQQHVSSYIVYFVTNFFYIFLNQTGMSNWNVTYLAQEGDVRLEIE